MLHFVINLTHPMLYFKVIVNPAIRLSLSFTHKISDVFIIKKVAIQLLHLTA